MYRQTIEKYPTGDTYYEGDNLEGLTPEEIAAMEEEEYADGGEYIDIKEDVPTPQPTPEAKPCSCKDKAYQPQPRSWLMDAAITAGTVLVFIVLIKMILK